MYTTDFYNNIICLFLLFSGGVVIYFDRIEVVNILEASSGEIWLHAIKSVVSH